MLTSPRSTGVGADSALGALWLAGRLGWDGGPAGTPGAAPAGGGGGRMQRRGWGMAAEGVR